MNSYSTGSTSPGGLIPYFRISYNPGATGSGSSTAKYWTPNANANNTMIAGGGGTSVTGGVGGIVFIEYVG
jgi:hypothetical protein